MKNTIEKIGVLFSVKILHPYFKDNICTCLAVEPDASTKSLFINRHMLSKNYPGEIKIIAPVNETKENTSIQSKGIPVENKHYAFLLKVTDTIFYKITNLDFTGIPKQIFYFSNTLKSTKLSVRKCFTVDGTLRITFEKGKTPSNIIIQTQEGIEVCNADINKTDSEFIYNMVKCRSGLYTAVSSFAKASQQKPQSQVFYYSSLIRKEPVLGVIDIDSSGFNNTEDDKKNYIIQFETAR